MQINKIEELKWVFFNWCGLLSEDEIVTNQKLISSLRKLEQLLIATA